MSTETLSLMDDSDFTRNLNVGKEALIRSMIQDGIISEDYDIEKLSAGYVLIVKKPGLFGKLYDKIFNNADDSKYISCLRSIPNIKENAKKDNDTESTE